MSDFRWMSDLIGTGDHENGQSFDFRRQKEWIDLIVDELEENINIFFSLMGIVQTRHEINNLARLEPIDLVEYLRALKTNLAFEQYEIPDKYLNILLAVRSLRRMQPPKQEPLIPYKRKRTQDENLQWITNILACKSKTRNLRGKNHLIQSVVEETKLDIIALTDRSSREIENIIEESQLQLIELKHAGDSKFADLQDQTSKKVLDLESIGGYRELVHEHDQKRRKITKLTVQLQLWVKKYDKFVGEPMKELEALEEEVSKFEEWKETVYDPQEEKYNELLAIIDAFETELTEEQVAVFRIAHAARIIQRGWRRVLEKRRRRKQRKKKRGGMKKKGVAGKQAKTRKK
ncbi:uncharacterized protein LOC134207905 [Armigeres subalbatus]|uniref:uncharacterized protein LOC134207905 n=1 Tax=Armigeres subalbatus TaxID=124917 RepID=UPI002ED41ECB